MRDKCLGCLIVTPKEKVGHQFLHPGFMTTLTNTKYRMVNISNTKWSTPHQSNEIIFHPVDKIQTSKYGIIV